jgi:acyl-CoA dehydrogenase
MVALEIYREVPGTRIPGGSEDVLLDLAVRQLVKNYQAQTKQLEKASKSKI